MTPTHAPATDTTALRRWKRYPAYRDSGVEWFGDIPSHWELKPTKHASSMNAESLTETTSPDYEMEYVDIGNVTSQGVILNTQRFRFENAPSRARKIVRHGDTILSTVRTYLRAIAYISDPVENMIVSTGFAVLRPNEVLEPRFLWRAVQAHEYIEKVVIRSVGIGYPAISPTTLATLPLWVPPLDEQRRIVAFLDRETAKLDALIAKKERLIALLREKRTALISHAVTKGLDPNVPMKDSAVAWLGAIPEHWQIIRLKYVVTFQRGHDLPNDQRVPGDIPVMTSGGATSWHNTSKTKGPGIVTGRYGTVGAFHFVETDYWPHNTTLYSIDIHGNMPRFLWYLLHPLAELFLINSAKSAVPGVDRNDIHPIPVAVPPVIEQSRIATFLDRETAKLDALIAKVREAIDKLREYRTALISAAVTGKIDVREMWAV